MQLPTLSSLSQLSPILVLFAASVVATLLASCLLTRDLVPWWAAFAVAASLGAALRLWVAAHSAALGLAVPIATEPLAWAAHLRVDDLAASGLVVALLSGLAAIGLAQATHRPTDAAGIVAGLFLSAVILVSQDLAVSAGAWTALVTLGLLHASRRQATGAAEAWLILGCCTAPLLADAGTGAAGTWWVVWLLAIVGTIGAGLTPIDAWLVESSDSGATSLIADALLPLVSFLLVARAIGLAAAATRPALAALLLVAGTWGIARSTNRLGLATDLHDVGRAIGRGEVAIAVAALVIGTKLAALSGLFLLSVDVLARLCLRRGAPAWASSIGWASLAGLPPLPGFVGRLLVVVAAVQGQQWLVLGVVLAMLLALNLGTASGLPGVTRVAWPRLEPTASGSLLVMVPAMLLVAVGLAPLAWLATNLLATGPDTVAFLPRSDGIAIPLASLIVLSPLLFAWLISRPRLPPRRRWRPRRPGLGELLLGTAQACAELAAWSIRVVDERYNLAVGLILFAVAVFAFVK